jgi:GTP pyrophosphokinase
LAVINKPEYAEAIQKRYGFRDWDSVLAAIGHGGLKEGQVVNKLLEADAEAHSRIAQSNEEIAEKIGDHAAAPPDSFGVHGGIMVKGVDDVAVRFAKCCAPLPGDEIVGFVTRGRGVSIHRNDCVNIVALAEMERERLIEAQWQQGEDGLINDTYIAEIKIFAENRNGLLADITKIMAEKKIDIKAVNIRVNKQSMAIMDMALEIRSKEELALIIEKVRVVHSVIDVERV